MHHYMLPLKPLLPDLQPFLILLLPPSHNNTNTQIGLVLFNASRQQMDFSDAELRDDLTALHSVPPPMVDAAEAMLSALVQTQRPPSSKQRETSVYVGGPLPGVCRICGVDRYVSFVKDANGRTVNRLLSIMPACIFPPLDDACPSSHHSSLRVMTASIHSLVQYGPQILLSLTPPSCIQHTQRGRPWRRRLQAYSTLLRLRFKRPRCCRRRPGLCPPLGPRPRGSGDGRGGGDEGAVPHPG